MFFVSYKYRSNFSDLNQRSNFLPKSFLWLFANCQSCFKRKLSKELNELAVQFDEEPKHLILKTAFGYQKQYFHDIEYIEAQNKRVLFHLCSGQILEISEPLNHFEQQLLDTDGFFKCHRSYLVYLPNVNHFNNNELTTRSGQTIPIARGYGKSFKEAYFSTLFAE